jgi:hypothetical protein
MKLLLLVVIIQTIISSVCCFPEEIFKKSRNSTAVGTAAVLIMTKYCKDNEILVGKVCRKKVVRTSKKK